MHDKISISATIRLDYWSGADAVGILQQVLPVEPCFTDELIIAVRSDEDDGDPRRRVLDGRPQIHVAGTPRALEEMGRYLISLARLDSAETDVHEHFEDVQNDDGGNIHLIVRRLTVRE